MNDSPDRLRLLHILDAIRKIESYTDEGGEAGFRASSVTREAVLYNLVIIGEAARALSDELTQKYSEVPWPQIVGLRNVLTHEYDRVVIDRCWEVIGRDLPQLQGHVRRILETLP